MGKRWLATLSVVGVPVALNLLTMALPCFFIFLVVTVFGITDPGAAGDLGAIFGALASVVGVLLAGESGPFGPIGLLIAA